MHSLRPAPRLPRGWGLLVPVAFALAGVLFATSAEVSRGTDLRSAGNTSLPDLIRAQQHRVEVRRRAGRGAAALGRGPDGPAAAGDRRVAALNRASDRLALAAGTTAVRGPALKVALDDAHLPSIPQGFTGDDLVVHQQDVQAVVNALWSGGAEAMMLQDQRVISTSAVRCVGNTLILQGRVYSPPYTITAIGDTASMRAALNRSPEVTIYREYVEALGLGYDVERIRSAKMPAYAGSLDLAHAVRRRLVNALRAGVRGLGELLITARRHPAAVRGLAALLDRLHRRPRAGLDDRHAAAPVVAGPGAGRRARLGQRQGQGGAARRRVRPGPDPAVRQEVRQADPAGHRPADPGQGRRALHRLADAGAGRQLRRRGAPGDLRQAVQRDRHDQARRRDRDRDGDDLVRLSRRTPRDRDARPRRGRRARASAPGGQRRPRPG